MSLVKGIELETVKYRPRNEHVVIRRVARGIVRGVVIPEISKDAYDTFVVAIGPKVEDLKVGDKVIASGTINVDIAFVPGEKDLLVTKDINICLVVEDI